MAVLAGVAKARRVLSWFVVASLLTVVMAVGNGCSVYMATKQPDKKNLDVFTVGTPRSLVIAEIGQPQATEIRDGKRVDVFSFVQGYSKGVRAARAIWHGVADIFTLCIWEIVGTPTEAIFTGEKVAYEVTYDARDKVEKTVTVSVIHKKKEVTTQPSQEAKGEPPKEIKVEPRVERPKEETGKTAEKKE